MIDLLADSVPLETSEAVVTTGDLKWAADQMTLDRMVRLSSDPLWVYRAKSRNRGPLYVESSVDGGLTWSYMGYLATWQTPHPRSHTWVFELA